MYASFVLSICYAILNSLSAIFNNSYGDNIKMVPMIPTLLVFTPYVSPLLSLLLACLSLHKDVVPVLVSLLCWLEASKRPYPPTPRGKELNAPKNYVSREVDPPPKAPGENSILANILTAVFWDLKQKIQLSCAQILNHINCGICVLFGSCQVCGNIVM